MKKLLFLLLSLLSLAASAQIDSTQIPQTVTLTYEQICHIKDCIGTSGEASYFKFFRQVAQQRDTLKPRNQPITSTNTSGTIKEFFVIVSGISEGIGNPINDEIKAALFPQLTNPWLIRELQAFGDQLKAEREAKIQRADNYFKSIK